MKPIIPSLTLISGLTLSTVALASPFNDRGPDYPTVDTTGVEPGYAVVSYGYADRGVDVIGALSAGLRSEGADLADVVHGFNQKSPEWRNPGA
jgi:hypothetical protein